MGINPRPQTPKPDVSPPSQRPKPLAAPLVIPRSMLPRAEVITVQWGGMDITGTVHDLEVHGVVIQRDEEPAVGKTTRLPRHCQQCGDEYPVGAQFCIACGAQR